MVAEIIKVSHNPTLSAVVVNYNSGQHLMPAIQSLLAETVLHAIWVVDNASNDGSLEEILHLQSCDERLTVIRNNSNIGFGAACNIAMRKQDDSDWLVMNPDCVLQAGAVSAFLVARAQNPNVGILGGLVCNPDGTEQRGCRRDFPRISTSIFRTLGLHNFIGRKKWNDFDHTDSAMPSIPTPVEAVSGALMYLTSDMLKNSGGFDERYFLHCEDLDLCKQAAFLGRDVLFVPNAKVIHYQGASSRTMPYRVVWYKHRSMWLYYSKYHQQEHSLITSFAVHLGIWLRLIFMFLRTFALKV